MSNNYRDTTLVNDEYELSIVDGTFYLFDPNGGKLTSIPRASIVDVRSSGDTWIYIDTGNTALNTIVYRIKFSSADAKLKAVRAIAKLLMTQDSSFDFGPLPEDPDADEHDYLIECAPLRLPDNNYQRGLEMAILNEQDFKGIWGDIDLSDIPIVVTQPPFNHLHAVCNLTVERTYMPEERAYTVEIVCEWYYGNETLYNAAKFVREAIQ